MQCLMSLHQTLQGNKRKTKSPARHREAHRSRQVRLGCEVMEDRVLMSAGLPDYHFTAPALVAGTTQHNAPSSIGAFTKTPGGTTQRIVSNGSMQAVAPAAPSFTATAVSGTQINLAWTPVAATGYQVDKLINGVWKQIGSLGSGSTGYAVTGFEPQDLLLLRCGRLQRGRHERGEIPIRNHIPGTTARVRAIPRRYRPSCCRRHEWQLLQLRSRQWHPVWSQRAGIHRCPPDHNWRLLAAGVVRRGGCKGSPGHHAHVHRSRHLHGERCPGSRLERPFLQQFWCTHIVIVDNELPVKSDGNTMSDQVVNGVLWVALAEKAYIQAAGRWAMSRSTTRPMTPT